MAVVVGMAVVALLLPLGIAGPPVVETSGIVRIERAFHDPFHFFRDGDAGSAGVAFPPVAFGTPAGVASVDLVVTLTATYRTSRGDSGEFTARLDPLPGKKEILRPGRFAVDSHGSWTTSSVTWIRRSLPASGSTYEFELWPLGKAGPDSDWDFRGRKFSVVIEMWTAG